MVPELTAKLNVRRWLYVIAALLSGVLLGNAWSLASRARPDFSRSGISHAENGDSATALEFSREAKLANRELSPRDVVLAQVRSLRDARNAPEQIVRCYELASPGNRAITGPLERFSVMVSEPPFDVLSSHENWQVGAAFVEGRNAVVLVTTCDNEGEAAAFRFVLAKQTQAPFEECWMTESVLPTTLVDFEASMFQTNALESLLGE